MASRSSRWEGRGFEFPELPVASPSDIDDFLEDDQGLSHGGVWDENEEGEEADASNTEESKKFWQSQHQLLQAILCRGSPMELRIRRATREVLEEIELEMVAREETCNCGRPSGIAGGSSCRNCLMEKVSSRLQKAGYNIAICKTKWPSSHYIPSGEHTFLDVLETSKKRVVRVIMELNFRAEFEMARASEDYNDLLRQLPEVFIGKVEILQSVIRILCSAAKKCMKEKKMHIGPWRKQRYMQAKWLGPCDRRAPLSALPIGFSGRPQRARASMLTVDLMEKLRSLHQTPVEAV